MCKMAKYVFNIFCVTWNTFSTRAYTDKTEITKQLVGHPRAMIMSQQIEPRKEIINFQNFILKNSKSYRRLS